VSYDWQVEPLQGLIAWAGYGSGYWVQFKHKELCPDGYWRTFTDSGPLDRNAVAYALNVVRSLETVCDPQLRITKLWYPEEALSMGDTRSW
jgi:hypothetical protein